MAYQRVPRSVQSAANVAFEILRLVEMSVGHVPVQGPNPGKLFPADFAIRLPVLSPVAPCCLWNIRGRSETKDHSYRIITHTYTHLRDIQKKTSRFPHSFRETKRELPPYRASYVYRAKECRQDLKSRRLVRSFRSLVAIVPQVRLTVVISKTSDS